MTRAGFGGYVEFALSFTPRAEISHVLFDFDGTLSLIRQGWPEVMLPLFLEVLPRRVDESETEVRQLLYDDIMRLNGKQTVYQMIQLAERIKERGGVPKDPLWYKKEYLRRLDSRIGSRIENLKSGAIAPDEHLVFGSRRLLEELAGRNWKLYLASGTDEAYVRKEAALLKVDHYFQGRIYGAKDEYRTFSKKMIIDRILSDNSISGSQLLAFGDGYVEIENTKEAGGLAIAVASDEANNGSGNVDPWKRQRLLGVGADAVIPDYRDAMPLLREITGNIAISNSRA
jgi:phosphoglycolate phosphatase-like HAD superfamily hydrolase